MPARINILCLKRTLRTLMNNARTIPTMEETEFICPIKPRETPKVLDMSTKKRAVIMPRVLTAKFDTISEGRNIQGADTIFSF